MAARIGTLSPHRDGSEMRSTMATTRPAMTADEYDDYVRCIVVAAPPLSASQGALLRSVLGPLTLAPAAAA